MDSYQKSNPKIFKYRTCPYLYTSNLFEIQTLICLLYEDVIRIELLCYLLLYPPSNLAWECPKAQVWF
jgi:hypothetical protein